MGGHVNHRGWVVLESFSSSDGMLCIDIFQDPGGGFGFEYLRRDPEDQGRWTAVGGFSTSRYVSPIVAAHAARRAVSWLAVDPASRAALQDFLADQAGATEGRDP